jgi:crotonobetainyl-CoA:carnitine CoA-transferase CaiB-like acyl-CoA transferase
VALPVKLQATAQGSVRTAPPLFGQHTEEVLAGYGLAPESIQELLVKKVVFQSKAVQAQAS